MIHSCCLEKKQEPGLLIRRNTINRNAALITKK